MATSSATVPATAATDQKPNRGSPTAEPAQQPRSVNRRALTSGSGLTSVDDIDQPLADLAAELVHPNGARAALLEHPAGMRTRELSQARNGDRAQVLMFLKEQEEAGQVGRTGTRAETRRHAITDEDRIGAAAVRQRAREAARCVAVARAVALP